MTWQQTFEQLAEHYTRLAMTRGWWAQAQHQVRALESDPEHGQHWQGLRAEVARRVRAANFRPHPSELIACDRQPEPWQPSRRWPGR